MEQQTKEPWRVVSLNIYGECNLGKNCPGHVDIEDAEGNTVNPAPYPKDSPTPHHIVACVNACAEINPEAVPDLMVAAEGLKPLLEDAVDSDFQGIERWYSKDRKAAKAILAAIAKAQKQSTDASKPQVVHPAPPKPLIVRCA